MNFKNRRKILSFIYRYSLKYASKDLQNSRKLVLAAVIENGPNLEYASDELKNDIEVVKAAISNNENAIKFASESIQIELEQ